jgi:hypothetical protein
MATNLFSHKNNPKIKKLLDAWEKNNKVRIFTGLSPWELQNKNAGGKKAITALDVFVGIYSFRIVIETIDIEISNEVDKIAQINSSEKTMREIADPQPPVEKANFLIKTTSNASYKKRLIDRWDKLDDIGFSTSEMNQLNMTLNDVMHLRYINHVAFIRQILDSDELPYEYEMSVEYTVKEL